MVERRLSDVKDQGEKLGKLREQATYIKGGIAAATVAIGVAIWIASSRKPAPANRSGLI